MCMFFSGHLTLFWKKLSKWFHTLSFLLHPQEFLPHLVSQLQSNSSKFQHDSSAFSCLQLFLHLQQLGQWIFLLPQQFFSTVQCHLPLGCIFSSTWWHLLHSFFVQNIQKSRQKMQELPLVLSSFVSFQSVWSIQLCLRFFACFNFCARIRCVIC